MQGSALPVLQARLLTHPSVYELIQEHISKTGVITLLWSPTKFLVWVWVCEWAWVCEGWQVNEATNLWANPLASIYIFFWKSSLFHFHGWCSLEMLRRRKSALSTAQYSFFFFYGQQQWLTIMATTINSNGTHSFVLHPLQLLMKGAVEKHCSKQMVILPEWCFRAPI